MKRYGLILILCASLALGAMLVAGCDDDETTKPELLSVADLAGAWTVTKYEVTHKTNPLKTVDFVAYGAEITITAQESGSFAGQAIFLDPITFQPDTTDFAGDFALDDDTVTATFNEEYPPYLTSFGGTFTWDGTTITITDEDATFTFLEEDGEEAATAVVALRRT